jgi:hypothetical protein
MSLNVPDSFYDPLPESKPERHWRPIVAVATLVVGLLIGIVSVLAGVSDEHKAAKAEQQQLDRTAQVIRDALKRPADSVSLPPEPDGSKSYSTGASTQFTHTFHLTLPRGWNARHVASQASSTEYIDTLLTKPGRTLTYVLVERIDIPATAGEADFEQAVRNGLADQDFPRTITSAYTKTKVGEYEAYYLDATFTKDGVPMRSRVVAFTHDDESFLVDFTTAAAAWDADLPEFRRIAASFGYGH